MASKNIRSCCLLFLHHITGASGTSTGLLLFYTVQYKRTSGFTSLKKNLRLIRVFGKERWGALVTLLLYRAKMCGSCTNNNQIKVLITSFSGIAYLLIQSIIVNVVEIENPA